MIMSEKKLTAREELFCRLYASSFDSRASAAKSGYLPQPEKKGVELTGRKEIQQRVEELLNQRTQTDAQVREGLRRLALGGITDALRLIMCEETLSPEELEKLDLMNVAEIKRPKGGGLEIKFFDRIKAFEKLSALAQTGNSASDLVRALEGAGTVFSSDEGDE